MGDFGESVNDEMELGDEFVSLGDLSELVEDADVDENLAFAQDYQSEDEF